MSTEPLHRQRRLGFVSVVLPHVTLAVCLSYPPHCFPPPSSETEESGFLGRSSVVSSGFVAYVRCRLPPRAPRSAASTRVLTGFLWVLSVFGL